MPTLLTRETFISADYIKIAATQATMFRATADGEGVEEVPVPSSVRETGIIPDGYSVGESFHRLLIHAAPFLKPLFQTSFSIHQPSLFHSKNKRLPQWSAYTSYPRQTLSIYVFILDNSLPKRCRRSKMLLMLLQTLGLSQP